MKARLLVAEDEPAIRAGLVDALEGDGYEVVAAVDGRQALALFPQQKWDLVLLDVMMPHASGFDVCQEIRRRDPRVPVLFLTAKGEEVDKVVGLRLGADDYITKPFGLRELFARLEAALRRARLAHAPGPAQDLPDRVRFAGAEIDRRRIAGRRPDGAEFELTPRELGLIETFLRHPGETLSRDQLLNAVWGVDYFGTTRTLDQHIAQVRKKTEPTPDRPRHLVTVHGFGYRYDPAT
jgi:DNA-binding response OmpR family regulator